MYNDYSESFNLYENVSTGNARRARAGVTQRVTASQAADIRRAARTPQQPIPEPKERQQRKGVKLLPSGGVGAEDKVLRGGYARSPYGIARAKLARLKKASRDLSIPMDQTLRIHRRIADMEKAIKDRKTWGTKEEEIAYILGHLIEEGYVETYEAAAEIAENMSDDWLYSVLYE